MTPDHIDAEEYRRLRYARDNLDALCAGWDGLDEGSRKVLAEDARAMLVELGIEPHSPRGGGS